MSNESENKRIDLTQFEGITKGEWVYHEGEDRFLGKTVELHIPHPASDNEIHRIDGEPATAIIQTPIEDAWPKKEDIKAMSLTPDLIAELKRCYEELDEANQVREALWNVLDNWDICMDDYSMHDLYNGLDEKYAHDDEGRIILKELYSYTKEDGWQPKESASE